jgi:hypothetical protein
MARSPLPIFSKAVLTARAQIAAAEDELVYKKLDDVAFGHRHRIHSHINGWGYCEWCGHAARIGDDSECPMFVIYEVTES